jgi:hypothetical protein
VEVDITHDLRSRVRQHLRVRLYPPPLACFPSGESVSV